MEKINEPKKIKLRKIDSSTVIIGFTGPVGSGCTYISEYLPTVADRKKYLYFKLSDIIKDKLKEEGKDHPSTEDLQNKGNQLRKELGGSALIELLLDKIEKQWNKRKHYGIIIDGIKNAKEVETLRSFPNFLLISVQALTETRKKRVIEDGRFKSDEEFDKADNRDKLEIYDYGQQASTCSYLSDIIIYNEKNIAELEKGDYIRSIYIQYINLIEFVHDGTISLDTKPSVDELCMTIAYSLSKASSCLKRKVGAVVVDLEKYDGELKNPNQQKELPIIISSGYNEVPFGQLPCKYHPDYGICFRDYLKQEFAKELKFCPSCGDKIVLGKIKCNVCGSEYDKYIKTCSKCHNEIEYDFFCNKCGENIFDYYIPGGKKSPGKLMDMCRSLHAEEMSLLKLKRNSFNEQNNLVLYVTTQPCNLCANKIVTSGIKKVVFSEPYSMKESQEILDNGGVKTKRFQGVKSSAFFKLYK
jgi:deoxycytidylate deaminase